MLVEIIGHLWLTQSSTFLSSPEVGDRTKCFISLVTWLVPLAGSPGPDALSGSNESRFININSGLVERGLWIIKDAPLTLIIQKIITVFEALSQELGMKMKYVFVTSQYYLSPLLFLFLVYLLPDVPQTGTRLMTFAFVVCSSWNAVLLNALMDHFPSPSNSCLIIVLRKAYLTTLFKLRPSSIYSALFFL